MCICVFSQRWAVTCFFCVCVYVVCFWPQCTACRILVPWLEIKPALPALELQSLNHWTTRKVPRGSSFAALPSAWYQFIYCCLFPMPFSYFQFWSSSWALSLVIPKWITHAALICSLINSRLLILNNFMSTFEK